MDKIYIVMETEAYYDGTYGDCKAIFNDREKAINYARKIANEVREDDPQREYDDDDYRYEFGLCREYDKPLSNGMVAEFNLNTGNYYDWDYECTSYYSVLVFEKEIGKYFIKNNTVDV